MIPSLKKLIDEWKNILNEISLSHTSYNFRLKCNRGVRLSEEHKRMYFLDSNGNSRDLYGDSDIKQDDDL